MTCWLICCSILHAMIKGKSIYLAVCVCVKKSLFLVWWMLYESLYPLLAEGSFTWECCRKLDVVLLVLKPIWDDLSVAHRANRAFHLSQGYSWLNPSTQMTNWQLCRKLIKTSAKMSQEFNSCSDSCRGLSISPFLCRLERQWVQNTE